MTVTPINDAPVIEEILSITNTSSIDETEIIEPSYGDYRDTATAKPIITFRVSDADTLDGMTLDPATVYQNIGISVAGSFVSTPGALTVVDRDNDKIEVELTFDNTGYG